MNFRLSTVLFAIAGLLMQTFAATAWAMPQSDFGSAQPAEAGGESTSQQMPCHGDKAAAVAVPNKAAKHLCGNERCGCAALCASHAAALPMLGAILPEAADAQPLTARTEASLAPAHTLHLFRPPIFSLS